MSSNRAWGQKWRALIFLVAITGVGRVFAATDNWTNTTNTGNLFATAGNWNSGVGPVPGLADTAQFNQNSTYTVLFGNSPTNTNAYIAAGTVSFSASGGARTYTLSGLTSLDGGNLSLTGNAAILTLAASGNLSVFNGSTLTVNQANAVSTGALSIAVGNTSAGTASFDGSGTNLSVSGGTSVGGTGGSGSLTIQNSATATLNQLSVASDFSANTTGSFTLQGSSATVTENGNVNIQDIAAAGQSAQFTINGADNFNQTGAGLITLGNNSALGSANLTVQNGGTLTTGTGVFTVNGTGVAQFGGVGAGTLNANGNVTVYGGTLSILAGGNFNWAASKSLVAQNGGHVNISSSYNTPSGGGNITVTGIGSTLSVSNGAPGNSTFYAGNGAGTAVINVQSGGHMSPDFLVLGYYYGNGTVTVDGAGSNLTAAGTQSGFVNAVGGIGRSGTLTLQNGASGSFTNPLLVADSGNASTSGTLNVNSGATLSTGNLSIASSSPALGATGAVNISGASSKITMSGASTLTIGSAAGSGTGTLNLTSSGVLVTGSGLTTINPTGSILTDTSAYLVAFGNILVNGGQFQGNLQWSSSRTMNIQAGGRVTSNTGGFYTPTNATISIDGIGSQLNVPVAFQSSDLSVQNGATMNVTNGGLAHADVYVVVGSGSTSGALNVSGVNSAVTPGFSLYVGDGGTGVATFSQSCTATTASTIIGTTPGGNGTLNVQTGAQLTLGALTIGDTGNNATGVVNLTDSGSSISLGGSSTLVVGGAPASGAANLNVLVGSIFTGGTALSTINATGTVTVGAANGTAPTFNANGNITVNGGNFTVANTGVFNWAASKTLTVQSAGHFSFTSPSLYYYFPSNSTVLVTGTGSHLSTAWAFQVSSGSQMTVNAGASLSASATVDVGNSGTLTIDGPGTTAVIGSPVYQDDIGFSGGPGTVTASNGAVATLAGSVSVGNDTVPGTAGVMSVQSGATLSTYKLYLANVVSATTTGTATVTGAGSHWNVPGGLVYLGQNGNPAGKAVLNVNSGGTFLEGTSTLNTFVPAQIGSGTFYLYDSGVLNVNGGSAVLGLMPNGGTINFSSGSLGYLGDMLVGSGGLLGSNVDLVTGQSLALNGTTTINAASILQLDGNASFSTGTLVNNGGTFNFNGGTLAITNAGLTIGAGGFFGANLNLPAGKTLIVAQTTTVNNGSSLSVTGGGFTAGTLVNAGSTIVGSFSNVSIGTLTNQAGGRLFINQDQLLSLTGASTNAGRITLEGGAALITGGGALSNTGVITGAGEVANPTTNSAGGQIFPNPGQTLVLSGANAANAGLLNLNGGEIDTTQAFTNGATGVLSGRGTLRATGGLTNNGQFQLSGGFTDVYGAFTGNSGSQVIVTGGGTTTFYSAVQINNGSTFQVSTASTAVFFGSVHGGSFFTGPGTKDFEAGVSAMGVIATPGSTIVQVPASVTADAFDENALTVSGLATVSPKNGGGQPSNTGTSVLGSLTINAGGLLDLTNNDMIVRNGNLADITNQIKSGYNLGAFTGTGITSSAARNNPTHLTTLGVLLNNNGGGNVVYATFDNQSVGTTDVLVKYTYYGDANLDGKVDGSDYSRIDSGYLTHATGWYSGDFNYDGVVNGSDYTLIDNAFNTQGAALTAMIASPAAGVTAQIANLSTAAVPEPASIGMVSIGTLALLSRRTLKR